MTSTLDLNFLGIPGAIAAFLLPTSEGPVLIETGPHSTFEGLTKSIESQGYKTQEIKHVFLTHIHLDHAGAAWAFAELGATIYVHPFGAKHLISPEKLMDSARRIYQDDMDRLWGQMHPIPEERIKTLDHEEQVTVGNITLTSHHTPGHARHHIAWQVGDEIFTGDVAGVKIGPGPVMPPCPPPDIDLGAWKASLQLIRKLNPKCIRLTHYGAITAMEPHLTALENCLDDWAHWIKGQMDDGKTAEEMTPDFIKYTAHQLRDAGVEEEGIKQYEAANPSWMSVAGLIRYWTKQLT